VEVDNFRTFSIVKKESTLTGEGRTMAKSSDQSPSKSNPNENFRSARATVWRELGSIREAARTGTITKVTNTYSRSGSSGQFSEHHKDKK
jgi:hypothetical protein